jgi:GNAT superfamily N-acetyltransferase
VLRLWCGPRRWRGPPEEGLRRLLDKVWDDPRQALLVAELDGRVVGFARVALADEGPCPGRVETLFVDADLRGAGVGRELMGAAESWLREHGADEVAIEVVEPNTGSRRFYEGLGYEPLLVTYIRPIDR